MPLKEFSPLLIVTLSQVIIIEIVRLWIPELMRTFATNPSGCSTLLFMMDPSSNKRKKVFDSSIIQSKKVNMEAKNLFKDFESYKTKKISSRE